MGKIFLAFLRLGLTSFGGPSAHVGYFHSEFVIRRGWLSEAEFAERLALAQFLPGPASSQLGLAIGLHRGGVAGALAAFLGFTLPSALFMALAGLALLSRPENGLLAGALEGLKLVALAVVAQAVLSMARSLCPDWPRRAVALFTLVALMLTPAPGAQAGALFLAALAGMALAGASPPAQTAPPPPAQTAPQPMAQPAAPARARHAGAASGLGLAFLLLSLALALWPAMQPFLKAGALVFGGGHVILPLLHPALGPVVGEDMFMSGYGLAQALPGPLSSFATYLGAVQAGWAGALAATLAIFAPGFALYALALPVWARLRGLRRVAGAVAGVNAAVVGLLAATWFDQLAPYGLADVRAMALSALLLALAFFTRLPPLALVALGAGMGAGLGALGL